MMSSVNKKLGTDLCRILGLDVGNVQGITLRCHASEVVAVTVERFLDDGELDEIKTVLEEYEVVRRDEPYPYVEAKIYGADDGDIFVFRLREDLSAAEVENVRDDVKRVLKMAHEKTGRRLAAMVLEREVDVAAITDEQLAKYFGLRRI